MNPLPNDVYAAFVAAWRIRLLDRCGIGAFTARFEADRFTVYGPNFETTFWPGGAR